MADESVDLIYLDPPFNSNHNYAAPIGSKAAGSEFKDTWSLSDIDKAWWGEIAETNGPLYALLDAAGKIGGDSVKSYLIYMAVRIIEMHRILKPAGSLYLHCDPTMSHYLKMVLDSLFGYANFVNEIIWHYGGPAKVTDYYPEKHDVILFYSKTPGRTFNRLYGELPDYLFDRARTDSDGRKWVDQRLGELTPETVARMEKEGRIFTTKRGGRRRKQYLDEMRGAQLDDVWDIPIINSQSKERTGFPTQKPLQLLRRIIESSSDKGDVVFDPFCGCATACLAAEQLGRRWIGIDISEKAAVIIASRLKNEARLDEFITGAGRVIHRKDIPQRAAIRSKNIRHVRYGEQEGRCNGCNFWYMIKDLELDHIVPKIKGGSDDDSNLQLLCGNCNRIKGGKMTMEELVVELDNKGLRRGKTGGF